MFICTFCSHSLHKQRRNLGVPQELLHAFYGVLILQSDDECFGCVLGIFQQNRHHPPKIVGESGHLNYCLRRRLLRVSIARIGHFDWPGPGCPVSVSKFCYFTKCQYNCRKITSQPQIKSRQLVWFIIRAPVKILSTLFSYSINIYNNKHYRCRY